MVRAWQCLCQTRGGNGHVDRIVDVARMVGFVLDVGCDVVAVGSCWTLCV
jgi:hypothetical protein